VRLIDRSNEEAIRKGAEIINCTDWMAWRLECSALNVKKAASGVEPILVWGETERK
jgi:hypothetical protein